VQWQSPREKGQRGRSLESVGLKGVKREDSREITYAKYQYG
jgi:hypothetical protein